MLLELTTTQQPATDLGFLLHKNPARAQSFDLAFGRVHVFYPEASAVRCTAAPPLPADALGVVARRPARALSVAGSGVGRVSAGAAYSRGGAPPPACADSAEVGPPRGARPPAGG